MKQLANLSAEALRGITVVLTDIDDTLTTDGRLTSAAYSAMEALHDKGIKIIPVTGRSAGWCDHISRMWPVDAVVGENGAFYFRYDDQTKIMHRRFSMSEAERSQNSERLLKLRTSIESTVTACRVASDQDYRIADLAIDFAEDVSRLSSTEIKHIVEIAESAGAIAKISSIHVNCWFGEHNKLSTSLLALKELFGIDATDLQSQALFAGDSPNDAQMFGYFNYSVGVANVRDTLEYLTEMPTYVCENNAGKGFVEITERILSSRESAA
jgi:HAD superfamily hydrolase (TIGR01484 family)